MRLLNERLEIENPAIGCGILEQHPKNFLVERELGVIPNDNFNSDWQCSSPHHCDGLRMAGFGDKENVPTFPTLKPVAHRHRLGSCRRLIEQRSIRNVQTSKVSHHRLEVEQRFEPAL